MTHCLLIPKGCWNPRQLTRPRPSFLMPTHVRSISMVFPDIALISGKKSSMTEDLPLPRLVPVNTKAAWRWMSPAPRLGLALDEAFADTPGRKMAPKPMLLFMVLSFVILKKKNKQLPDTHGNPGISGTVTKPLSVYLKWSGLTLEEFYSL